MFPISLQSATGTQQYNVDKIPDCCPICHRSIRPIDLNWGHVSQAGVVLEKVFTCPAHSCNRLFVARYSPNHTGFYFLRQLVPTELNDYPHAAELQKISPDFCAIHNQAHKAEALGLTLVSGPGYRKALEFLIKDYLASLQTTDEAKAEIANSALMHVIKKFVADKRMLATAERATWLGNDETHYVRKWGDKDLQDMKNLIQLTCYWIQSEHLTNAAIESMPVGKK